MSALLFKKPHVPRIFFQYHFLPVGQGLFSAGSIRFAASQTEFRWVYDCGTLSAQSFVDTGIKHLQGPMGYGPDLDLVVLSHFDKDHISGITRLIGEFKIKNLLLPFMSLEQRLVLALEEGVADNPELLPFFVDPVNYLTSIEGANIERVILVEPGAGDGGAPNPEEAPPPEVPPEPIIDLQDGETRLPGNAAKTRGGPQVATLRRGGRIRFRGLWEFVPYNADPEVSIPAGFATSVRHYETLLLKVTNKTDRDNALADLKKTYDDTFGYRNRNIISLFLYSGPIYHLPIPAGIHPGRIVTYSWSDTRDSRKREPWVSRYPDTPARQGILYTGDGYLETPVNMMRLENFLGLARIKRVALFQVMHHGSRRNWHEGVAAAISPLVSVFSSDPMRKDRRHPHAAVLRDFWTYNPVQVDKDYGLSAEGWIY